jgi:cell volume regulation protein A
LIIGMLAGSEGPGGIDFENFWAAQSLGILTLAFILYSGGLDTEWRSVRPLLWRGVALSTLGVLGTALLVGWFSTLILNLSLFEGLLLGAIVSSTDAAAVFTVLRSRKVILRGDLKPLLELESGSNDPMAVFLTIGFIHLLTHPGSSLIDLIPMFLSQMILGAALGYTVGRLAIPVINHIRLEYQGLYSVLTVAAVLLTYGATASLGGNGFLAVYLAGLVMGNHEFIHKRSLMRFHDGLAWVLQIAMFLTLGLLVFPSRLVPVAGVSLLVSLFLMFVARPLSVFAVLSPTQMRLREKVMVSWVGLRGAVPIILATYPMLAGLPKAELIFNIIFFIVLTSVLLQGTTVPILARRLGLDAPISERARYPLEFVPSCDPRSELAEVTIPPGSAAAGKQIVDLRLPEGILIVLINRRGECFVPAGGTVLESGDTAFVLADRKQLPEVRSILGAPS